jgi:hypothetical protein
MSSATSGYTVFTGEMQHDCPCSSASSSEDDVSAVEGIDASSQAISTSQGTSSLSHLLDGSSQSYWCSLPHDLYKMAGTCVFVLLPFYFSVPSPLREMRE